MLNLKKVIASICVIAMVLSTVAFGATYTDVAEDSAYYEAVETLNKLDIITGYEDGTFKPEDGVTRAEMAALIARIQGYGETAKGAANTAFTDVPASHWASGYIANASGMGIINGYGDGTFGPEDPVLYEQAVKMIMATLGYTPFAEKNGGYPTGYLAAAQRYDVSLAVANAAVGTEANRGTIAQLLVNALDTPLMVQTEWNTNGEVVYEIAEGKADTNGQIKGYKTLMSENLGYVKIRGTVEANTLTDVDNNAHKVDTSKVAEVWIMLRDDYDTENKAFTDNYGTLNNEYSFLVGGTDIEDCLGRAIVAYTKKDTNGTDKFEIVSYAIDASRNEVLTIGLDQFEKYAVTNGNHEIEYYAEGATKSSTVKLEADIDTVFNYLGGYHASDLNTKITNNCLYGGEITLIDNDTDNGYDVAVVKMAATAVVKKVTDNGISLYNNAKIGGGAQSKTIYIYPEDYNKSVKIYKDGEEIDFAELAEWDILSVYADSRNADVIVAEVVANEVVGTITSTKASDTSSYPAISGLAFKVSDTWYDVAEGAYQEGLDVGVGGKFYIDEFGKIAAFIEDSALAGGSIGNYGYVVDIKAMKPDFGSTGLTVKAQLLTNEGLNVVTIKNNAKLDGVTMPIDDWTATGYTDGVADDVDEPVPAPGTGTQNCAQYDTLIGSTVKGAVVKYTVDSNGYINSIITAGYTKSGATEAEFTKAGSVTNWVNYDAENGKFVNGVNVGGYITDDATVFVIGSTEQCTVATAADLADKVDYSVSQVYTTKNANDADIIVVPYNKFNGVGASSNVAVVTGISKGVNEAGEEAWTIDYLQDGAEVTATTTSEVPGEIAFTLTEGDVVKIKMAGNLISKIEKVWDFAATVRTKTVDKNTLSNNGVTLASAQGANGTNETFVGGKVVGYKEGSEEVTFDGTTWYKISRAEYTYEINNNLKNVAISVDGAFESLSDKIYDNDSPSATTVNIRNNKGQDAWSGALDNVADSNAQFFADYVYIRNYDGKVIDVVIVKGLDVQAQ